MSGHFHKPTADRYLVAIRAGASSEVAAAHAGVDVDTVRAWQLGSSTAEQQFDLDVKKARADLELLAVGSVRRVIGEDRAAAMWLAERMHGDSELERLRRLTT